MRRGQRATGCHIGLRSRSYVTAREQCDIFSTAAQPYQAGHAYYGSAYFPNDDAGPFWGALRAIDPVTGKSSGNGSIHRRPWAGVLSTAGGLVFTGDAEGNSSRSMRRVANRCGTFRRVHRFILRRWRMQWMGKSMLRWLPDRRCLRWAALIAVT